MLDAEYVVPLRWHDDRGLDELTAYLGELCSVVAVTVVDGSAAPLFACHAAAWHALVRHVPVASDPGVNGKVRGVLTGLGIARHDRVVIADDDVRYTHAQLAAVVDALAAADLVKPQNHFAPLPWHARWDTGRTLLNRALGADYPGTYGLRRSLLLAVGGYDPGVLFENLELERTVRAAGGRVVVRRDLLVARRPPTTAHFLSQRVRQAYDSWAQPLRFAAELAVLPALIRGRRHPLALVAGAVAVTALAEAGRRRAGGRRVWPSTSALWAPVWLLERGATSWCALALRARGGVRYAGGRLARAATPTRMLRRRLRAAARP
jgi:hypothetical protein